MRSLLFIPLLLHAATFVEGIRTLMQCFEYSKFSECMPPVTLGEKLCNVCFEILHNIQSLHYLHGRIYAKVEE